MKVGGYIEERIEWGMSTTLDEYWVYTDLPVLSIY